MGGAVADTTSKLKSSGDLLVDDLRIKQQDLRDKIGSFADTATSQLRDDDTRNQLLLGIAGVAIAAALGIIVAIAETASARWW